MSWSKVMAQKSQLKAGALLSYMEIGLNIEEEVEEEPKEGKLINMFDYTDKGEQ